MSRRSKAREIVLQVLYQDDMNSESDETIRRQFVANRLQHDAKLVEFANQLLEGVRRNKDKIDQLLDPAADNWKLSRMAVTDRNVLRIGAYEILYSDTPDPVAVNEAIELAKRFGTNNSSQFVNGVLDRIIKSKSSAPSTPESGHPAESEQVNSDQNDANNAS